ncbi:hypothetical protein BDC45DRAFT_275771 [Circinella umbellata]|nr:hypothetical protein BDC45DRAFT_275771 [Circinella umbellata]
MNGLIWSLFFILLFSATFFLLYSSLLQQNDTICSCTVMEFISIRAFRTLTQNSLLRYTHANYYCIMKNVFAKSQVDNFPKLEYLAAVSIETCYLSLSQNYSDGMVSFHVFLI